MPGAGGSDSTLVTYLGLAVAIVAAVGHLVFDWSFRSADGSLPFVIGAVVAAVAVGWYLLDD